MQKLNLVKDQPFYQEIYTLIEKLKPHEVLTRFRGNCIAATDLIQNLLYQHGIDSKIIEVQLTATKFHPDNNSEFILVGYDELKFPGQVDTHLVVITETEIPLLIDCSIGHILEHCGMEYILHPVNGHETYFADYRFNDVQLTYQIKKNIRIPSLHQRSLLDRMMEEKKIKDTIQWLKIFTMAGLAMSLFNMFANSILLILKMIFP